MTDTTLRYVVDVDISDYQRAGWMVSAYYGERGSHSCFILEWRCQCPVNDPRGKSKSAATIIPD